MLQPVGHYYKGMAVFTIAKGGLMYQAAIAGQKFSFQTVVGELIAQVPRGESNADGISNTGEKQ